MKDVAKGNAHTFFIEGTARISSKDWGKYE